MEYYSAIKRDKFELVELRWMNQEPVAQSEVIQKEKDKYHTYMESRKIVQMNLFAGQEYRCRHREELVGTAGEVEGRMIWENITEI